jgi:D-alanyl-D-alanine carboxypeptidase
MNSPSDTIIEQLGISRISLAARGLREYREAGHLEVAEIGDDGKAHLLIPTAARAWREIKNAAGADRISVFIVSAFRGIERQAEIIRNKLDAGEGIEDILKVCAPPGYSEHHTGCAVDIVTAGDPLLEISFEDTPAFRWLVNHAHRYGFHLSFPEGNACGYHYEPWHWCFHPRHQG